MDPVLVKTVLGSVFIGGAVQVMLCIILLQHLEKKRQMAEQLGDNVKVRPGGTVERMVVSFVGLLGLGQAVATAIGLLVK